MLNNPTIRRTSAALLACALTHGAHAQKYLVTDLGSLAGPVSQAFDVNLAGHVVGTAYATAGGEEMHGYFWNGAMADLGTLGGDPQSVAFALNDAGTVVGVSYLLGELHPRAFQWHNGAMTTIGVFTPRDINAAGDVVGTRAVGSAKAGIAWVDRACVLTNGSLTTLGTLGGSSSYGYGISVSGEVVGSSQIGGDQAMHAFRWNGGGLVDLGTLGGGMSQAYAINGARQVVGVSETASGQTHAFKFVLDAAGTVTQRIDLGELGGGGSCAYAINDAGNIVGASNGRAVLWKSSGIVDLNARIPGHSGWVLDAAMAINASGFIVGYGRHNGVPHSFLLTPNPNVVSWSAFTTNGDFNGRTRVTWDAFPGAADYQVQRMMIPGGTYAVIADHVADTRFDDRDSVKCQKYRYRVRARNATGGFLGTSESDVGWRGTCAAVLLRAAPGEAFAPPSPERAADIDGDGRVDVRDLIALISDSGACDGCSADLDGDGRVDGGDVSLLLSDWD